MSHNAWPYEIQGLSPWIKSVSELIPGAQVNMGDINLMEDCLSILLQRLDREAKPLTEFEVVSGSSSTSQDHEKRNREISLNEAFVLWAVSDICPASKKLWDIVKMCFIDPSKEDVDRAAQRASTPVNPLLSNLPSVQVIGRKFVIPPHILSQTLLKKGTLPEPSGIFLTLLVKTTTYMNQSDNLRGYLLKVSKNGNSMLPPDLEDGEVPPVTASTLGLMEALSMQTLTVSSPEASLSSAASDDDEMETTTTSSSTSTTQASASLLSRKKSTDSLASLSKKKSEKIIREFIRLAMVKLFAGVYLICQDTVRHFMSELVDNASLISTGESREKQGLWTALMGPLPRSVDESQLLLIKCGALGLSEPTIPGPFFCSMVQKLDVEIFGTPSPQLKQLIGSLVNPIEKGKWKQQQDEPEVCVNVEKQQQQQQARLHHRSLSIPVQDPTFTDQNKRHKTQNNTPTERSGSSKISHTTTPLSPTSTNTKPATPRDSQIGIARGSPHSSSLVVIPSRLVN